MKRHEIHINSSPSGTWAYCATCHRSSKQGTKAAAEKWMADHQIGVIDVERGKVTRR